MTLTEIIDEIERLDKAATNADWYIDGTEIRHDYDSYATDSGAADCSVGICDLPEISGLPPCCNNDRELIAHYRNVTPKLARAARVMFEALLKYKDMLHSVEDRNYAKDALEEVEGLLK